MIRIPKGGTWTNNQLNYSWTPNQAVQLQTLEALIQEETSTQPIPTISKATYQTWRKLRSETRSHGETHHIPEVLVEVGLGNLRVEQLARTNLRTSHSTHRLPRTLAPRTPTSIWTSSALRVAETTLLASLQSEASNHSIACKTSISKCNNSSRCSKWCKILVTQPLKASKELRAIQKDKEILTS
jgi:hypothetical protein